jgi:TPR repeat protein
MPLGMWLSQTILSSAIETDPVSATASRPHQMPRRRRRGLIEAMRSSLLGFLLGVIIIGGAIFGFVYILNEEEASVSPMRHTGTAHIVSATPERVEEDPTTAKLAALRAAAAEGDPESQTQLGLRYLNGDGMTADPAVAAEFLEQAAVQGYSDAQYTLAQMYENGRGRKKDPQMAFFWYDSAATRGSTPAAARLGELYAEGSVGAPKDYVRAASWFKRAADAGDANSQFTLGYMYLRGLGVNVDPDQAHDLWQQAADKGNTQAQARLQGLDSLPAFAKATAAATTPTSTIPSATSNSPDTASTGSQPTPAEPAAASNAPLSTGDIAEIQQLLKMLAFDPGNTDGNVTQDTTDAIGNYQRLAGIKADGQPSAQLLTSLRKVTGSHQTP